MTIFRYRPEIDGLRAIAVFAVVSFHAEFEIGGRMLFAGGYIGVDIFFVISGYLITSIILNQMEADRFTLLSFYERRARRILPVLFTVIVLSIPMAWIFMLPDAMKEYAGSVLSSLFFSSNFWFWLEDSYWAEPGELKPFLHTWSLSVEEQFYVFYPLVLLFVCKYFRRYGGLVLASSIIASILFAEYAIDRYPDFSFYLLPTRGWELLAGAILAWAEQENGYRKNLLGQNRVLSIIGLVLVFSSFIYFDNETKHPSFITLVPVLGTMTVIWCCQKDDWTTKILSIKPIVGMGLISYGFYLWHYPVFAFSRIIGDAHFQSNKVGLVLLALIMSVLSYFIIEKPARNRTLVSQRVFFSSISVCLLTLFMVQFYFFQTNGVPTRMPFSEELLSTVKQSDWRDICRFQASATEEDLFSNRWCEIGDKKASPSFLLIGDSHALAALETLDNAGVETGKSGLFLFRSGCPPLINVYTNRGADSGKKCKKMNDEAYLMIKKNIIDTVFLVSRWTYYVQGNAENYTQLINDQDKDYTLARSRLVFNRQMKETFNLYDEAGATVVILMQVPHQIQHPLDVYRNVMSRTLIDKGIEGINVLNSMSVSRELHIQTQQLANQVIIEAQLQNPGVVILDPANVFCENHCSIGNMSASYYFDRDHLSPIGFSKLKKEIVEILIQELTLE